MTSFELAEGQRDALEELVERTGQPRARILRRALQEYLDRDAAQRQEAARS